MEKLCINCKHYRKGIFWLKHIGGFGECKAPKAYTIKNPITGKFSRASVFATVQRMMPNTDLPDYCGNGKWFEQK